MNYNYKQILRHLWIFNIVWYILATIMGPETRMKIADYINKRYSQSAARVSEIEAARRSSESAMTSRFDTMREVYASDKSIEEGVTNKLAAFKDFIDRCGVTPEELSRETVSMGAEMTLELWDSQDTIPGAIFAPINVNLNEIGMTVITPDSPIGAAIEVRRPGNTFVYKTNKNGRLLAGVVKELK